jgi:mRNA-degrading endonuclease toxin of MazEF toxin-antitoxin module
MFPGSVHRGEIYYADLDTVVGSETGKTRPVLIIQNDIGNTYSPTTIVAVVTEYSEKKARYPICVSITKEGTRLEKDSIVNEDAKLQIMGYAGMLKNMTDEETELFNEAIKRKSLFRDCHWRPEIA